MVPIRALYISLSIISEVDHTGLLSTGIVDAVPEHPDPTKKHLPTHHVQSLNPRQYLYIILMYST